MKAVLTEISNDVMTIKLNRPESMNALNDEMGDGLLTAVDLSLIHI